MIPVEIRRGLWGWAETRDCHITESGAVWWRLPESEPEQSFAADLHGKKQPSTRFLGFARRPRVEDVPPEIAEQAGALIAAWLDAPDRAAQDREAEAHYRANRRDRW